MKRLLACGACALMVSVPLRALANSGHPSPQTSRPRVVIPSPPAPTISPSEEFMLGQQSGKLDELSNRLTQVDSSIRQLSDRVGASTNQLSRQMNSLTEKVGWLEGADYVSYPLFLGLLTIILYPMARDWWSSTLSKRRHSVSS